MHQNTVIPLQIVTADGVCPLEILHQDVPDGDDVAQRAGKHEKVEHGVHVAATVERIENGAGNVTHTFGDNPYEGGCRYGVDEGFEGHEDAQAHADEAKCLDVGVFFEVDKADDGTYDGTCPYEYEQSPTPVKGELKIENGELGIGVQQGDKRQW